MTWNFKRTKYACYSSYLGMSSIFTLPPLLFVTFRQMYGISYTLLGTLVLINFSTQLLIDLIFTFFSKHFNIKTTVRTMPLITSLGLFIYAFSPLIFSENVYIGLVIGTFIFSISAGLSEVLLSPIVAACPSKNPERDMSLLHSLYAYGVLFVIIISTVFFALFGRENWMYLTIFFALLPLFCFYMFSTAPIPEINISNSNNSKKSENKKTILFFCVICIFLGGAAENTMTNWISGYMEKALNLPKTVGDIFGMAIFAAFLGLGRTLYSKYGKNISNVLLGGMLGATACYLLAGLSSNAIICAVACILTGFFTSMLWPGTLILMEEKLPSPGVAAYALMAAGGDFGASVAPQLLGIVVDRVSSRYTLSNSISFTAQELEQFSMKSGMLMATIFPILGIVLLLIMRKYFSKKIHKKTDS